MKRSEAARYARWSALAALVLAAVTIAVYLERRWSAHLDKRNAPPAAKEGVERESSGLTFSKVDGQRTIFTVQASKSTDFKGQNVSLLERVNITVFGKNADRHDVIRTESCQLTKSDGGIRCDGAVEMDMQSASDAEKVRSNPAEKANVVHVVTSGVTFDRATGKAQTAQPVKFVFPNGSGEGIGAIYFSEEGTLHLMKDVLLKLKAGELSRAPEKKEIASRAVQVRSSSLEFAKSSRSIFLAGPVTASTEKEELTSGELVVDLDRGFHAESMVATAGANGRVPQVSMRGAKGDMTLSAEKMVSRFAPEGWIRSLEAEGNVRGNSASGRMQAERGEVEMWPKLNQAKLLTLRGNVDLQVADEKAGTSRSLKSNAVQLAFAGGKNGAPNRMQRAETLERGALEWTDAAAVRSKLSGDKLAMDFGALGKARQLVATGAVQTEREMKGKPLQTASAANGLVEMGPAGDWTHMTLRGNVRLKEGDRNAQAEQAIFARTSQTAVLTGQAVVRDASSETHAAKFTFRQLSGEMEAEGNVRSTDLAAKTGGLQLAAAPANISSDAMRGNSKTGRAIYSGHARLWQGPSVLEAETIELQREAQILIASGNVRAVFPQAASAAPANSGAAPASNAAGTKLWHVASGVLTYWDKENRAYLEKNVSVQSTDQKMRSSALELFFTRDSTGKALTNSSSQISRAVGTGGVVVEEGARRGTAERGVYTAADQKFVLSGGTPTLYDASEGATTGRELTFYIADDTIIVDSGTGQRTLTRHRVQR